MARSLFSAQALHCLAASVTAPGHSGRLAGGHVRTGGWGQGEAVSLRALEDHLGQREQIRGPFE